MLYLGLFFAIAVAYFAGFTKGHKIAMQNAETREARRVAHRLANTIEHRKRWIALAKQTLDQSKNKMSGHYLLSDHSHLDDSVFTAGLAAGIEWEEEAMANFLKSYFNNSKTNPSATLELQSPVKETVIKRILDAPQTLTLHWRVATNPTELATLCKDIQQRRQQIEDQERRRQIEDRN